MAQEKRELQDVGLYVEKYKEYYLKQGGAERTSTGKLKSWGYLIIYKGFTQVNRIKYVQGSSGFFFNNAILKAKKRIDAGTIEKYKIYKHKKYGPNATQNGLLAGMDYNSTPYTVIQTTQI